MKGFRFLTVAAVVFGQAALADDAALILANDRYERLGRVSLADDVLEAQDGLAAMGFDVVALRNGREDQVEDALADFLDASQEAERQVIVLAGQFVTDGARTWFLTSDARQPALLSLGSRAVSVDSLLQIAARTQGQAIVLLAPAGLSGPAADEWLRFGLGDLDAPQGVTIIRGLPRDIADFANDALIVPGADLASVIANNTGLLGSGYLPRVWMPMPDDDAEIDEPEPPVDDNSAADTAAWDAAKALDTVEALRDYIRRFPGGAHTAEAETLIADILAEPNRAARKLEEALNLTRDQRRDIQSDLTLLDYSTRGVDGIFGPGTRRAITNWQQVNGYSQTGYMTPEQITRLDAQAARRAAELAAEAERQRAEQARLDRAYWEETGARGDEPGYRAYLNRYPDGIFADVATEQLRLIEDQNRSAAAAQDRQAWDRAVSVHSVPGYRDYLRAFPTGAFVAEAEDRIAALEAEADGAGDREAAMAAEASLNLNPLTSRLIEGKLRQLGLDPGEVDGVFDETTRRAIRRYQRARDLPVTGYIDDATLVRLLADSVSVIGR